MKELLVQYAAYNLWANKIITDHILMTGTGAASSKCGKQFPHFICHRTAYVGCGNRLVATGKTSGENYYSNRG